MRKQEKIKTNQWWVFIKDGEYYAVEDKFDGIEPKGIGIEIVGTLHTKKPIDAIDYIKLLRSYR